MFTIIVVRKSEHGTVPKRNNVGVQRLYFQMTMSIEKNGCGAVKLRRNCPYDYSDLDVLLDKLRLRWRRAQMQDRHAWILCVYTHCLNFPISKYKHLCSYLDMAREVIPLY